MWIEGCLSELNPARRAAAAAANSTERKSKLPQRRLREYMAMVYMKEHSSKARFSALARRTLLLLPPAGLRDVPARVQRVSATQAPAIFRVCFCERQKYTEFVAA